MTWELRKVEEIECTIDNSGVYTDINRIPAKWIPETGGYLIHVRLDLMQTSNSKPIMSWQGTANNVRKGVIKYLTDGKSRMPCPISREHASYIGYELHRAETDPNYVQD